MDKHTISYYSKSDGKKLKRPYDPNPEKQYEFTAKSTGNLCKRYWDVSKNGWRTAKSRWKISPIKKKGKNEMKKNLPQETWIMGYNKHKKNYDKWKKERCPHN